jgi:hypothetical protein
VGQPLGMLYAALRLRSSTMALAVVVLLQIKNRVKGSGQECPLYTRHGATNQHGIS